MTAPAQDPLRPKFVTALAEGYGLTALRADALAGITVAIVALPLSMAIAIASGLSPAQGLTAAIIGGGLVSLLGGSRHQIGGPAGAFIVLVLASVERHGPGGLALATLLSGLMLAALGFLRLGSYVKFIPYPVTVGFTAGIGLIILASQITPLLGLSLPQKEPGPLLEKLPVLWDALPGTSAPALAIGLGTAALILILRRWRPKLPSMLIAVALAALVVRLTGLDVATIGSQFGGLPRGLPAPALPDLALLPAVLPDALAFTMLGAIESLLSALVADGMTGRRHRPDMELVAQGVANIASGLFGAMPVTGTIARTATNVRAGATSPVSGMLHALFLLLFLIIAAPLAALIPLAALAGVLVTVCIGMIETRSIATLFRAGRGEALIFAVTLALTLFRELSEAIVVGFALGAMLYLARAAQTAAPLQAAQEGEAFEQQPGTLTYRLQGPLFFGAVPMLDDLAGRIGTNYRRLVLDLSLVPFIDISAANALGAIAGRASASGVSVTFTGTDAQKVDALRTAGVLDHATVEHGPVAASP